MHTLSYIRFITIVHAKKFFVFFRSKTVQNLDCNPDFERLLVINIWVKKLFLYGYFIFVFVFLIVLLYPNIQIMLNLMVMETFFLLSLGITFILIFMLVYHFKQRLNVMEQKCDTTFEILQNVVNEITLVKSYFSDSHLQNIVFKHTQETTNPQEKQYIYIDTMETNILDKNRPQWGIDDEEDEEDDETDDGDDGDDGDEDDGENEFWGDDDGDEEEIDIKKIIVNKDFVFEKIKIQENITAVINDFDTENIEVLPEPTTENIEVFPEPTAENIEVFPEPTTENIEVFPETENIGDDEGDDVLQENEEIDFAIKTDDKEKSLKLKNLRETYQKMNIQTLKSVAITKGVCGENSKLKKNEIIQLLLNV